MSTDQGSLYRLRPEGAAETPHAPPSRPTARGGGGDVLPRHRILIALGLMGVLGVILVAQLIRYQAFGVVPQVVLASSQTDVDPLLMRGTIVDRNGHPLALDSFTYDVIIDPLAIKEPEKAAEKLAPLLDMAPADIANTIRENSNLRYLVLARGVGPEAGEQIKSGEIFSDTDAYAYAITVEPRPKRYYPEGNLASHVLGFVPENRRGYYGIEGYYDSFLRQRSRGQRPLDPPTPMRLKSEETLPELPESPFIPSYVQQDLVLTLDRTVQHVAEVELAAAIEKYEAEGGSIIILEPNGSAVLAMASWPGFNPNDPLLEEELGVYVNPVITDQYEPGSVFKLITYAAALEKGTVTPETVYEDEDEYIYGERPIQNWNRVGIGKVTVAEALAKSLNVPTAKIAVDMGADEFYKRVSLFGFGQLTGVELQGEITGLVKVPGKAGWYPADLATNAFGQGISVTPLQMANAVAAIASDGVLYQPHVVHQIIDGERFRTIEPKPINIAISAETAKTMIQLMVNTVENTAKAKLKGYAIAGKSGTAEIPLPGGYKDKLTIASFAGFFPADDPQFVILVKLDRPKADRWATNTAAPTFREVVQRLIDLYAIPPDYIRLENRNPLLQP